MLPVKFMNQHRNKKNLTFGLIAGPLMSSCVTPSPPTIWSLKRQAEENAKAAMISGFSQVLYQAADFQITLNSFNMKQEVATCFTVPRINPILCPCIQD
ncbi:hypothetical protein MKW98_003445 [Papaver atlanticum]|uniref:Uncharacterized protein n=1 Tax=Papaver atlanticum TaxID=357466 RepID=A0AAD4TB68_9MAGN|nr:hypothetical protein MKW98_003445 [Papaver atlanticum]